MNGISNGPRLRFQKNEYENVRLYKVVGFVDSNMQFDRVKPLPQDLEVDSYTRFQLENTSGYFVCAHEFKRYILTSKTLERGWGYYSRNDVLNFLQERLTERQAEGYANTHVVYFNKRALMKYANIGDLVVATKYSDGDPNDPWSVGFVQDIRQNDSGENFYYVGYKNGGLIHPDAMRRCRKVSEKVATRLMKIIPKSYKAGGQPLEAYPQKQRTVWGCLELVERSIND